MDSAVYPDIQDIADCQVIQDFVDFLGTADFAVYQDILGFAG